MSGTVFKRILRIVAGAAMVSALALSCEKEPGGDEEVKVPELEARVVEVDSPRMKIYFPPTEGKRCPLTIVCPGGGYSAIPGADGYEGAFYKDLFNEAGYALAVLYYTLPEGDPEKPVSDMENALKLVRAKADEWYVDKNRVGVMGFSAGGHLASYAATHGSGDTRPDYQILFYPVITMEAGKTHAGSRQNLLGPTPSETDALNYSNQIFVAADTPPAFIAYAKDDTTVPPKYNGEAYFNALEAAGVPVSRIVYKGSRHGWHWGSFVFDGSTVSDGTKYDNLDDVKSKLSVWLATGEIPSVVPSTFSGGKGTVEDPWQIATKEDLLDLASAVASDDIDMIPFRSAYYKQMADIDFAGATLPSIGNTNAEGGCYFEGSYDGNGFSVIDAVIANPVAGKANGFFGYLAGNAHINGLKLVSPVISSTTWNNGAIVGCVQTPSTVLIENCVVTGAAVSSTDDSTGGICGKLMSGTIRNCTFHGTVVGSSSDKNNVGGIVGNIAGSGAVQDSKVLEGSAVWAAGNNAGGICGRMPAGASVVRCSLEGSSVTGNMHAGGICGLFDTGGYISTCSVSGSSVTASTKLAGGILGNISGATAALSSRIEECVVSGGEGLSVSVSNGNAGGILGGCDTYGIVDICSASIDVCNNGEDESGCVGGIVGWCNTQNLLISNSIYYGGELHCDVATGSNVGGICGQFHANASSIGNATIVNCCAFPGTVSSKKGNIGGIAGSANTVTIRNCYCPVPGANFLVNGAASNTKRGSIYGYLSGFSSGDACSGVMEDVYWLEGFKIGASSSSFTYIRKDKSLTDAQMKGSGAVSRPSNNTAYSDFIAALNAAVADYNASGAVFSVSAQEWVMGTNGYPVPCGTALAGSGTVSRPKRVSLLGDSITTYQGYTPYPNNYQYPKSSYTDFTSVTQTYWYQIIYNKMSGAILEVNSSYTGTCVQNTTDKGHPGYGFLQRYVELGYPDIILINGGTNDAWSFSLPVGELNFNFATDALDTYQFAQAYDKLIRLLKERYPSSAIGCIIGDNVMDPSKTEYAQVIRDVCSHYNLPYAEVVFADRAASTYDNVHPNPSGMADMANQIYNQLKSIL